MRRRLTMAVAGLLTIGALTAPSAGATTDAADWQVEFGEDPGSTGGEQGVVNVRSASGDVSSDGSTRYSECQHRTAPDQCSRRQET